MLGRESTFYWTMFVLLVVLLACTIPWWWFHEISGNSDHARRRLLKLFHFRFSFAQLMGATTLLCGGLGIASLVIYKQNLLGSIAVTAFFGAVIFAGVSLAWYFLQSVFQSSARDTLARRRRPIQFSILHLAGFTLAAGLVMTVIRVLSHYSDMLPGIFGGILFVLLVILPVWLFAIMFFGAGDLNYGRGNGQRINRLRELKKDKEIRLPTTSTYSSNHPPRDFPPGGPGPKPAWGRLLRLGRRFGR